MDVRTGLALSLNFVFLKVFPDGVIAQGFDLRAGSVNVTVPVVPEGPYFITRKFYLLNPGTQAHLEFKLEF